MQPLKDASIHHEMNLIDFLHTLWRQKLLILLVTAFCLFLGIAYLLLSHPVYEAVTIISPPSQGDIATLNQGRSSAKNSLLKPYQVKEVYAIFTKALQAESTKRLFFNTVFLPSWKEKTAANLYPLFSNSLIIKEIKSLSNAFDPPPSNYIVAIRGVSPEQDAQWLSKYIDLAKRKALEEVMTDDKRQRSSVLRDLHDRIDSIREVANAQRLDRIQQLKEAIKVAHAVDAKGKTVASGIIADAEVMNNPSMMYLRGSAALKAELDNIEHRGSSDAFAPKELKLRETQSRFDFYKKAAINSNNVLMFQQDGEVIKPDSPIAPRKKLILLLSLCAGLVLGIMGALTRKALSLVFRPSLSS
ncbi:MULTISPECIES: LPS O-antigen chain length determinant protein WzzB [Legionella]|uniref:Chain length determinant protein n=1 Tax=Legionella maceachernii TaxID=466 RepID=A0A0W0WCT3_9GAMM|nr:Wzz/FepE/Etk N-terminal domain-containing protein [Legionella maceachernii]KTD30180.1 Chain length determinant protein [Legionella maceachernii]SJZ92791.1 chain length determinant protein (polysaccharide antigen chain regulator) [Legionella maceachernii]SUP03493.1 Polysaccharide antigen chain regulator [Legionella maceachernii]